MCIKSITFKNNTTKNVINQNFLVSARLRIKDNPNICHRTKPYTTNSKGSLDEPNRYKSNIMDNISSQNVAKKEGILPSEMTPEYIVSKEISINIYDKIEVNEELDIESSQKFQILKLNM